MLGVNKAARKWAQKVGVDPYTTNPILKKALTDLGRIDAAGGIAAKVVVPIPMVVSGTASVGNLVWAKDPEEVLKINEQKFRDLGVGADVIKQLYLSKGFSLSLHTRFATNLAEVHVPGCGDYVATAAESDTEREALFFVESAEMLARFHKTAPVAAVLPDSRALVAKTKDGRAVVLLPVDWVSWTEAYEKALGEVEKRAKARARRHEARAADDRDDVGGREEGDGRARLDRGGERALDVRGRAGAREGGPEDELARAPHPLEAGTTALARSSQASVLPKSRSVSRVPQRRQTRCRALVVILSWPKSQHRNSFIERPLRPGAGRDVWLRASTQMRGRNAPRSWVPARGSPGHQYNTRGAARRRPRASLRARPGIGGCTGCGQK